jgi:hypothetical protein
MPATSDPLAASRVASARSSGRPMTAVGQHSTALVILIIAIVVLAVLPELLQNLSIVRALALVRIEVGHPPDRSPYARVATMTALVAVLVVCSIIVLIRGRTDRNISGAVLLLLGLLIPYAISPALPRKAEIAYVVMAAAVILALWSIRPSVDGLKWVSISGAFIGAYAIIGGISAPEYMNYVDRDAGLSKALIANWQLAGPFGHSNALGVYCVLAFALCPLIVSLRWRLLNGLVLFTAVVASASRTALIAAGVLAIWWAICRLRSVISIRRAGTYMIVVSAITMLALPFPKWNPKAFTGRSRMWADGISYWQESRLVGLGINWFTNGAASSGNVGSWVSLGSAHNLTVDTLIKSGLVGIGIFIVLLWVATRSTRGLEVLRHQIACFGYLIAFLVVSCTEAVWTLLPNVPLYPVVGLVFSVLILLRHNLNRVWEPAVGPVSGTLRSWPRLACTTDQKAQ